MFQALSSVDMEQKTVSIKMLTRDDAENAVLVAALADLINVVYAQSEEGLWQSEAERTTVAEVGALIAAGEIAVAQLGTRLAGSVRIQRLSPTVGEFGMLVAAPDLRGVGVGRQLLDFAERWAAERGLTQLELEVLSPREWLHPSKEFLRKWYTRIGFEQVRLGRFEDSYPALAGLLATPCDFAVYRKKL